jgi:hypothetical protein
MSLFLAPAARAEAPGTHRPDAAALAQSMVPPGRRPRPGPRPGTAGRAAERLDEPTGVLRVAPGVMGQAEPLPEGPTMPNWAVRAGA